MNEQLIRLIELQALDSEILSFARTIKQIPSRISQSEKPAADAKAALDAAKKTLDAAEKKKKDREREVEDQRAQVNKLKDRTNLIKDNKSYHAHLKEIEAVEKKAFDLEDGILEQMEVIESASKALADAKKLSDLENSKLDAIRKELDREVEHAKKSLEEKKKGRSALAASIEKPLYNTYMGLLADRDGLAVVQAAEEMCLGCNLNIMPQLFVEIRKNLTIVHCPQCKRVLYYKEKSDAPQEG